MINRVSMINTRQNVAVNNKSSQPAFGTSGNFSFTRIGVVVENFSFKKEADEIGKLLKRVVAGEFKPLEDGIFQSVLNNEKIIAKSRVADEFNFDAIRLLSKDEGTGSFFIRDQLMDETAQKSYDEIKLRLIA